MDNYIARYNKRQQCIRGKKDHNVGLSIEKHKCYLKSALMFFYVDSFLASIHGKVVSQNLYIFHIGANDYTVAVKMRARQSKPKASLKPLSVCKPHQCCKNNSVFQ